MVKKIILCFLIVYCILSSIFCTIYYKRYRQCNFQSEYNRELAERAIEENTKLKNAMLDIRNEVNGIRNDTGDIERINGDTINGIRECIKQLEQIRNKVENLEIYCNSFDSNLIGISD